ncbi:zeta toxin family protein [Arthrobacter stackebrandtii]|uniref:zeta toxin family protein n=1 Tax=Arthrobacter stackebrandtii TaxID=272161 RepID=UPI001AE162DD|nr:zeta toxin family protein [Arthrobacter stackebrandtii]
MTKSAGPLAGEVQEAHRALTELLAPGGALHQAPAILGTYFDDAAIIRTAHQYMETTQRGVIQDGRAVVVSAGPPAAGKSSVLNGLHLAGYRLIDPDAAKDLLLHDADAHGLLDYRSGVLLPDGEPVKVRELASHVHHASTRVADIVRSLAMAAGENIIIDGTLRWEPLGQLYVDELFAHGYAGIDVVDVEVPLKTALKRARQRWWDGRRHSPAGGRFVPEDAIRACYGANPNESLSAANAMQLAQDAAEGLGHGSLRRFDVDPQSQVPVQTRYTIFGT